MKRKKILIISPVPSHPQNAGNRARIYTMAVNLMNLGHDVYFAYEERNKNSKTEPAADYKAMSAFWKERLFIIPFELSLAGRIMRELKSLAWTRRHFQFVRWNLFREKDILVHTLDCFYEKRTDYFLKRVANKIKFDAVLVNYVWMSKAFDCFGGNVLKLLDTHDAYSDRHKIMKDFWFSTTSDEERRGLNRADVVIAIQDKEKEFFERLTTKRVIAVGHTVRLSKPAKRKGRNILFASSATPSNIEALRYFIKEVFPGLKARFPDVTLQVSGKICDCIEDRHPIVKLGQLKDIKEAYDQSDIVINPIFSGTGLKIKNIEALGYCKPLVTTPHGSIGLERGAGKAFLVAKNTKEFIAYLSRLLSDYKFFNKLSREACRFAANYNKESLKRLKEVFSA
jgi:glycosyltransferase involved in cell wall biosynthesis